MDAPIMGGPIAKGLVNVPGRSPPHGSTPDGMSFDLVYGENPYTEPMDIRLDREAEIGERTEERAQGEGPLSKVF